jgi:hypothetical protein
MGWLPTFFTQNPGRAETVRGPLMKAHPLPALSFDTTSSPIGWPLTGTGAEVGSCPDSHGGHRACATRSESQPRSSGQPTAGLPVMKGARPNHRHGILLDSRQMPSVFLVLPACCPPRRPATQGASQCLVAVSCRFFFPPKRPRSEQLTT